jgi:hypothetical protein
MPPPDFQQVAKRDPPPSINSARDRHHLAPDGDAYTHAEVTAQVAGKVIETLADSRPWDVAIGAGAEAPHVSQSG